MRDTFFDVIDTQEKAYWLGFLYADGYHTRPHRIGVKLALRDKSHIEKLCVSLQVSPEKIRTRPPSETICMGRIIRGNGSAEINICNKRLSVSSNRCGLVPNKSLILSFPSYDILPSHLVNHFVRGYFDGDGCLTKGYSKNATRYRIIILSSRNFCTSLCEYINSELNIKMKNWDKKKTNIYKVCISGNRQVKRFVDWMYNGATLYLDRKYILYKELCETINRIDERGRTSYSQHNNITFDKTRQKWVAMIRINKKTAHIGRFDTETEAVNAQLDFVRNGCQSL